LGSSQWNSSSSLLEIRSVVVISASVEYWASDLGIGRVNKLCDDRQEEWLHAQVHNGIRRELKRCRQIGAELEHVAGR
jgi:hypothetical protein